MFYKSFICILSIVLNANCLATKHRLEMAGEPETSLVAQKRQRNEALRHFPFTELLPEMQELVFYKMDWLTAHNFLIASTKTLEMAEKAPWELPLTLEEVLQLIQKQPTMADAHVVLCDRLQHGFWPITYMTKQERQFHDLPTFLGAIKSRLTPFFRSAMLEIAHLLPFLTLDDTQEISFLKSILKREPAISRSLHKNWKQYQDSIIESRQEGITPKHKEQLRNKKAVALKALVAFSNTVLSPEQKERDEVKVPAQTVKTILRKMVPYFLLDCIRTVWTYPDLTRMPPTQITALKDRFIFLNVSDLLSRVDRDPDQLETFDFPYLEPGQFSADVRTALRKATLAQDLMRFTFNRSSSCTITDAEYNRLYHPQCKRYYTVEYQQGHSEYLDLSQPGRGSAFSSQEEFASFEAELAPFITEEEKAYRIFLTGLNALSVMEDHIVTGYTSTRAYMNKFNPNGSLLPGDFKGAPSLAQKIREALERFYEAQSLIQQSGTHRPKILTGYFDRKVAISLLYIPSPRTPFRIPSTGIAVPSIFRGKGLFPVHFSNPYFINFSQLGFSGLITWLEFELDRIKRIIPLTATNHEKDDVESQIQRIKHQINGQQDFKLPYYIKLLDLYQEKAMGDPQNPWLYMWEFAQAVAPGPLDHQQAFILNAAFPRSAYTSFALGERVDERRILELLKQHYFTELEEDLDFYMNLTKKDNKDRSIESVSAYIEKYQKMHEAFHIDTDMPTFMRKLNLLQACLEMDNLRYPQTSKYHKRLNPSMSFDGIERIYHCLISLCDDPRAAVSVYAIWQERLRREKNLLLDGESEGVHLQRKKGLDVKEQKLSALATKCQSMSMAEFLNKRATMLQEAAPRIFPPALQAAIAQDVAQDFAAAMDAKLLDLVDEVEMDVASGPDEISDAMDLEK